MYHVGDKIVYPMYGAGVIECIEEKEVLGKKQVYYTMHIEAGDMTVMIPKLKCAEIGVRGVIDKEEATKVLKAFREAPIMEDSNWNKRHRDNLIKIKTGDVYQVLEVVKELMYRDKVKGLSTSERKMLNNAKQILISELVLSTVACEDDIESIMCDSIEALF